MSDELVQPDAPSAAPADGSTTDPAPVAVENDADPSLTTELIEKQIDRAIDAANTVAEAVEEEADDDPSDLELMGDFEAPDSATIEAATIAVEALHPQPASDIDAGTRGEIEEGGQPENEPDAAPTPTVENPPDVSGDEPTPNASLEAEAAPTIQQTAHTTEPVEPDESIEQIDAMLAEMAEDDFSHELEGEFHTVDQVVSGANVDKEPETTEQAIGVPADSDPTSDPVIASAPAAEPEPAPDPSPLNAATNGVDKQTKAIEGSFDSLEDLFGNEVSETPTSEPESRGAEAPDSEPQTDTPPESTSAVPTMTTPPEVPSGPRAGEDPARPTIGARGRRLRELLIVQARQLERRALKSCAKLNHPMRFLHPEMRDTVGWVALAVAVPGAVFFTLGMIF